MRSNEIPDYLISLEKYLAVQVDVKVRTVTTLTLKEHFNENLSVVILDVFETGNSSNNFTHSRMGKVYSN